jgi:hypothetical protein
MVLKGQKHDSVKNVEYEEETEEDGRGGGGGRLERADNNHFVPVCIGSVVKFVGCTDHDLDGDSRSTC